MAAGIMAENTTEVLAGAAVLAAALGFVFYAAQSTGFSGNDGSYDLKASFRSVEGITLGSDVRLAGVKVGTITSLDLNPTTYFADATVSVKSDLVLPDDSAILISSEGLLGGNFIELVPGGSETNLEPGDEIEDTQGSVSLISLLMKFVSGGSDEPAPATE
jgi:phospholipid/cholesterol/gamma-HCH transport system substrate-binding protein